MTPGRNDPCPCGSGRKFKHCCGSNRAPAPALPTRADRDAAWDLLDRIACLPRFQGDVDLCFAMIWGEDWDRPDVRQLMDTPAGDLFYEWLWLDHQLQIGCTVAEYALDRHANDVGPGSRRFLRACVAAPLRLLQVDRVAVGEGVHVRDVMAGGPAIAVSERLGSEQLVRHDVLTARLAAYDDVAQFEGVNILFNVRDKRAIAASIRRLHRLLTGELAADVTGTRVLRMATGAAIVQATAALFDRPAPQLRTSDGDELVFADVLFTILDRSVVRTSLAAMIDLELQDADPHGPDVTRYTWMAPSSATGSAGRHVLGSVTLEGALLRVETMSMSRARLAQDHFGTSIPSAAARFKGIQVKGVKSAIEEAHARHDASLAIDAPDTPESAAARREFMEQHYREWLDVPVPALANRTPREAAQVKHLRARLRELVDGIENQAAHDARSGGGFDVSFMRKALGLR